MRATQCALMPVSSLKTLARAKQSDRLYTPLLELERTEIHLYQKIFSTYPLMMERCTVDPAVKKIRQVISARFHLAGAIIRKLSEVRPRYCKRNDDEQDRHEREPPLKI